MGLIGRLAGPARERPPADVLARSGAEKGDRVLAGARTGESWVLGTPLALLVVPAEDGATRPQRIVWESVEKAGWDTDERVLEVTEVVARGQERSVHRFSMAQPEGPVRLLQLVRERVTASIVLQRRVQVVGKRGFLINARRPPTGGEISWLVDYDGGVRPEDPAVADLVAGALAEARAELI